MIPNRKSISLALVCSLLFLTLTISTTSCSNADVASAAGDVIASAQTVVAAMKTSLPAGDARFSKVEWWLALAQKFQTDFAASQTPGEDVQLLALVGQLTSSFQADILPLLNVSPNVGLAVAGIDAGLRIIARHFQRHVTTAKASGMRGTPADQASATAIASYLASPELKRPKR